jgi:integrase
MTHNRRRGRGEGSVFRRSDGRWEARLDLGFVNGKRKAKSLYARTRKEAAVKLRVAETQLASGALVLDERLTVAQWLEHWVKNVLSTRVANGALADRTLDSYNDTVRLHLTPGRGRHRLSKLEPAHIDAFIASKRADHSANSLRIMRSTMRKALQDAQRLGLVPRNVVALSEPVKVSRKVKKWIRLDEARELLDSLLGDRLGALYVLILSLGLRRGEALALAWTDVDLDKRRVHIHRQLKRVRNQPTADGHYPGGRKTRLIIAEQPKTDESTATLPLTDRLVELLRRQKIRQKHERLAAGERWSDSGLVFTTPIGTALDPDNLGKSFSDACKRAGLGHRNLHQLRHSAASILIAQGLPLVEVSRFLRHTTYGITADIYTHLDEETRRSAANAMGEALWGEAPAG